ncbi:MAG: transcriptional regulator [Candidatus Thiothrix moscowensis]|nr:transcriptional regulator [Candidatus Thiothrix moscowensis]
MRTLTIGLMDSASAMRDMRQSAIRAWETGEYQGEALTFATPAQLFKVFTLDRWDVIACLQQQTKPIKLFELSRLLGRNAQSLQEDLDVLLAEGVVEQDEQGISAPYTEIHTDFTLRKAA